jgi:hypothetical protein
MLCVTPGRPWMALRACMPHLRPQEIIATVPPPRPPRVEPASGCHGARARGWLRGPNFCHARETLVTHCRDRLRVWHADPVTFSVPAAYARAVESGRYRASTDICGGVRPRCKSSS